MMMTILYNLAFLVFGIFYLPVFLLKLRQAEDPMLLLRQRFGFFSHEWKAKLKDKKILWIHAVSVGEVMAVECFLRECLNKNTEYHFLLTTVTPTGQKIARKLENSRISVCYFPFDLTFAVRNFYRIFRPQSLLLVETEIWPNLLTEAKRVQIPVGILNARLSERSLKRYQKFSIFFKTLWNKIDFVLAQSAEDAGRFEKLGIPKGRVFDMGNMKFDQAENLEKNQEPREIFRRKWGLKPEDLLLIGGSTHPGEERVIWNSFLELRLKFPSFRLIIAPRHVERSAALLDLFKRPGLKVAQATQRKEQEDFDVLILNQIGILKDLYRAADFVFMGGSLISHGGQNPIEPARFARAILHGPHTFHFQKIYSELDGQKGAIKILNENELCVEIEKLLSDKIQREEMGQKAYQIINRLRGASRRQAEWVLAFLNQKRPVERINTNGQDEKLFSATGRRETS